MWWKRYIQNRENLRLIRFFTVGALNTVVGFGTIFLLMYVGMSVVVSNFIGYIIGITVSFFLNKKFTFRSNTNPLKEIPKFLLSLFISYLLNLMVVLTCVEILAINPYLSQILGGVAYTLSGYVLMRNFVFKE